MNAEKPAFPSSGFNEKGLSKRELIAAMVLQGYAANPAMNDHNFPDKAKWAVKEADALFAELAKD